MSCSILLLLAALVADPTDLCAVLKGRHIERILIRADFPAGEEDRLFNHLAQVRRELDRMYERYPRVRAFVRARPVKRYVVVGARKFDSGNHHEARGLYDPNTSCITVAVLDHDSREIIATVRHEFAHHLYIAGRGIVNRDQWKGFFLGKGPAWWREHVSAYAATNEREAFAESFQLYLGSWPEKVPEELRDWLRDALVGTEESSSE